MPPSIQVETIPIVVAASVNQLALAVPAPSKEGTHQTLSKREQALYYLPPAV